VGEATALYLWSRTAAARIAEVCPDARIIVILREPAGLLRSLHLQFVQAHVEVESDFAKALALEPARREGRELPTHTYWPQALLYSDHVRYVEQLSRYAAVFPREQMHIAIYDDFRADNEGMVRSVLRFLGVDETVPVSAVEANPTVSPRSQRLNEAVHAVSVGNGPTSLKLKGAVKAVLPRRMRRGALEAVQRHLVFREPPQPDEAVTIELRGRFRGEVQALSEYLGRDLLERWGYGDVE
jgi:hypothetical protein